MRAILTLVAMALVFGAPIAAAQLLSTGVGSYFGGSGGGGGCTNKLDFSVACNSQYLAVVL